jgi:hypothetical protein
MKTTCTRITVSISRDSLNIYLREEYLNQMLQRNIKHTLHVRISCSFIVLEIIKANERLSRNPRPIEATVT